MVDLKPDGQKIRVTNLNKKEFVKLLSEWHAIKSKKELLEEFCHGFWSVVPKKLINVLTVAEFEMMFNGLKQIDVDDWEFNTIY